MLVKAFYRIRLGWLSPAVYQNQSPQMASEVQNLHLEAVWLGRGLKPPCAGLIHS